MSAIEPMTQQQVTHTDVPLLPGIEISNSGYRISDAYAWSLRDKANEARSGGFDALRPLGSGDTHEAWKQAAQEFALATAVLCEDRTTRLRDVEQFWKRQPLWRRWQRWLPPARALWLRITKQHSEFLDEGVVAEMRREAAGAITDSFPAFEGLSRWEAHQGYVAGANFFSLATVLLCRDRALLVSISRGDPPPPSFHAGLRPRRAVPAANQKG